MKKTKHDKPLRCDRCGQINLMPCPACNRTIRVVQYVGDVPRSVGSKSTTQFYCPSCHTKLDAVVQVIPLSGKKGDPEKGEELIKVTRAN